jgi:1-acyl-sn-glycerol-3-phosphate acyltransferase
MTSGRPSPFWRAYAYLAMALGLGALALACLLWLPFAALLDPLLPQPAGRRLGRRAIAGGFRTYLAFLQAFCACRFELDGLERLRGEAPLVVVANHPSLLDAVMILSRLPGAACVIKSSLIDSVLFGAAARMARYIRNSAPLEMVLAARQELRGGAQLLIFPEGTRTRRFPVDRCLPSAGLIAGRSGVPVQALLVDLSSPYLGKDWPLFRPPALPLRCRVRVGRRFPPPQDAAAFAAELEAYFRSELAGSVAAA